MKILYLLFWFFFFIVYFLYFINFTGCFFYLWCLCWCFLTSHEVKGNKILLNFVSLYSSFDSSWFKFLDYAWFKFCWSTNNFLLCGEFYIVFLEVNVVILLRGFLNLKNQWKKGIVILTCYIYLSYSFLKEFLTWGGSCLK